MKLTQRDKNIIMEALEVLADVYIDSDVPDDIAKLETVETLKDKFVGT